MLWWTLRKLNSRNGLRQQEAIKELEGNRDADHLAQALSSHRDDVRKQAALALARLEDRRGTPELIRMARQEPNYLDPNSRYYQSSALNALCKLGDPAAIETVVEKLGVLNIQDAAILLTRFGAEATPYLENVLSTLSRPPSEVAMPLWMWAQGVIGQRAVDKAAMILDSLGWSPPPGPIQILFLILCGKYEKPSSSDIPALTELCHRELFVDIRLKVAEAFQRLQDPRAAEGLALLLEQSKRSTLDPQDTSKAAWETAVAALRQVAGAEAVIPLINVLTNPKSDFQTEAAKVLCEIGDARAVEPLLQSLKDDHIGFRLRADVGSALSKIRDPRAVDSLMLALDDRNSTVRGIAISALAAIKDARAVEPLLRLLDDPAPGIQESAARALGEIGDPRAVQPLRHLILRSHKLPTVGGFDTIMVPVTATISLGKIGNDAAIQAIGEALLHDYGRIADAAGNALSKLNCPRAIRPLITWTKHVQPHGGPPIYGERAIKQLCELLEAKADESSTEDLNLIVQIGQVRQADWGGTDDDCGYDSRDSHLVDTGHLIELAQQELHRRAARQ